MNDIIYNPPGYRIQHLIGVRCYTHLHHLAEITIVIRGSLTITFEKSETVLKAGQAMLIMPYSMHGYKSDDGDSEIIIIEFERLMFNELAGAVGFQRICFETSHTAIDYILSVLDNENRSSVHLKSIIYPLIFDMRSEIFEKDSAAQNGEIYQAALKYIDEHFDEKINLKTAAEQIGCSYVHLSRIFSKSTGISFTAYLNRFRIVKSVYDLLYTELGITEIAYRNGFETLRSYNREFKKNFGISPGEYRGKKHPEKE